jgi:cob(I)alamin adenosyltransferase
MKSKIYTKTGDDGKTLRANGKKISKSNNIIKLNGKIDFISSYIGFAITQIKNKEHIKILQKIQKQLFNLGIDISKGEKSNIIKKEDIAFLENHIDLLTNLNNPIKSFILPGGTTAASTLHLARCATREAETIVIELDEEKEKINPLSKPFINRLSDFLFTIARYHNNQGKDDITISL